MKKITATTLVRLREVPHEAGTVFTVTEQIKGATDVDPTTAGAWLRNEWAVEGSGLKAKAAGEGA